jgi:hypothetical protein
MALTGRRGKRGRWLPGPRRMLEENFDPRFADRYQEAEVDLGWKLF